MSDAKTEGNGEQGQLAEIKEIVERIEHNVDKIRSGARGDRIIQLSLSMMILIFSIVFAFLAVTLTSGVGERVYGERWVGYILGVVAAVGIFIIGFFVYKVLEEEEKKKEDIVDKNGDKDKAAGTGELAGAAVTKEAPKSEENKGTKQKSSCLSQILNKLCGPSSNGSELNEINATLKDMQRQMRMGSQPKEYTSEYIGRTVDSIEEKLDEMKDAMKRGRQIASAESIIAVGGGFVIALMIAGNTTNRMDLSWAAVGVLVVTVGYAVLISICSRPKQR